MGRLCGRAHEISGIKAPLFLHGWGGGWWGGCWWDGWLGWGWWGRGWVGVIGVMGWWKGGGSGVNDVLVRDVVGGGWRLAGGVGDGVLSG